MEETQTRWSVGAPYKTYAALRWLMVILPAVLFVVSIATALRTGELETSISAYYGGPLRDLFVGVLIAVAACLLAYRGSNAVEHYNLKGAGFYAIFVALVPTGLEGILDDLRGSLLLAPDGISPGAYVWSLRFSLTAAALLCVAFMGREVQNLRRRPKKPDPFALSFVTVTLAALVGFLALAMWQLWVPAVDAVTLDGLGLGGFQVRIHDIAAIFLLSALVIAVWSHAWPRAAARRTGDGVAADEIAVQSGYRIILVLMLAGPVVVGLVSWIWAPEHFVLLLEWWEIALFAVFWALETRRLARAEL